MFPDRKKQQQTFTNNVGIKIIVLLKRCLEKENVQVCVFILRNLSIFIAQFYVFFLKLNFVFFSTFSGKMRRNQGKAISCIYNNIFKILPFLLIVRILSH